MPKLCPNIRFPHQQDFFPIRSVTKSSTSRFSHENLVEKIKIFGQDFVPIRTALIADAGPHHYLPSCLWSLRIFPSLPACWFTPYDFLSRCKFSILTTRQLMVELYSLTFPRFPLRKKEHKSYFGKNRTHAMCTFFVGVSVFRFFSLCFFSASA